MSKKINNILIKEFFALIFILIIGAIFIYDPSNSKNFTYPLQMKPEWKDRFEVLGWIIVYGGYPARTAIKLFFWAKKQNK
jgi:hypothetical protein